MNAQEPQIEEVSGILTAEILNTDNLNTTDGLGHSDKHIDPLPTTNGHVADIEMSGAQNGVGKSKKKSPNPKNNGSLPLDHDILQADDILK